MSQQVRTYTIQPDRLAVMRIALASKGVTLPDAPSGSVDGPSGFIISWDYVAPVLTIKLDGSGWKMPFAWSKLEDAIKPFEDA